MTATSLRLSKWHGGALLLALAIAAVFAGAASFAPAPAAAMIQDGEECPEWGWSPDCEEPNGGGGDGGSGQGTQGLPGEPVQIPPGEVIFVNDTKPLEDTEPKPCTPKPGYLACLPPDFEPPKAAYCKPRQGYVCVPYCRSLHKWSHECPGGEDTKSLGKSYTKPAECPTGKGIAALRRCMQKLGVRKKWDLDKWARVMRNTPKCRTVQEELDSLRKFKGAGTGYSPQSWKALGYRAKEERMENMLSDLYCELLVET
jgi:hypothetical protein